MKTQIFTPASVADRIVRHGFININPDTCTKIQVGDYEISIAMDTSCCGFDKDMTRTEIRIYDLTISETSQCADVTQIFAKEMGCMQEDSTSHLFTDSNDLFDIMVHARNLMSKKKRA